MDFSIFVLISFLKVNKTPWALTKKKIENISRTINQSIITMVRYLRRDRNCNKRLHKIISPVHMHHQQTWKHKSHKMIRQRKYINLNLRYIIQVNIIQALIPDRINATITKYSHSEHKPRYKSTRIEYILEELIFVLVLVISSSQSQKYIWSIMHE